MDLVSALAPPRLCRLAGRTLFVRPYTLEDFAVVLAWLDDATPGKAERKLPPKLGDDASKAAMETAHGRVVLAWAALRRQGMAWDEVVSLVGRADLEEWATFLAAIFARRRTMSDEPGEADRDIAEVWFGPNLATLCERYPGHSLADLGRLTLDQYALLCGEGMKEEDPRHLTWEQVEAMRQEGLRLKAEREAAAATEGERS